MIKIIAAIFFLIVIPQLISPITGYIVAFKLTIIYTMMSPFLSYQTVAGIVSLIAGEIFFSIYHHFK